MVRIYSYILLKGIISLLYHLTPISSYHPLVVLAAASAATTAPRRLCGHLPCHYGPGGLLPGVRGHGGRRRLHYVLAHIESASMEYLTPVSQRLDDDPDRPALVAVLRPVTEPPGVYPAYRRSTYTLLASID
jgi:hypothetical protein